MACNPSLSGNGTTLRTLSTAGMVLLCTGSVEQSLGVSSAMLTAHGVPHLFRDNYSDRQPHQCLIPFKMQMKLPLGRLFR